MLKGIVNFGLKCVGGYITGHWFGSVTGATMNVGDKEGVGAGTLMLTFVGSFLVMYATVYRVINPAVDWFTNVIFGDDESDELIGNSETETEAE